MVYVTLVNRSSKSRRGTWDGRAYHVTPGKHEFPEVVALAIKRQNPIMGTGDPYDTDPTTGEMRMDYYIGIVEHGDNCEPLVEEAIQPSIEKWDRTKLVGALPSEVTPGKTGIYSVRDVAQQIGTPGGAVNSTFTKA